VAFTIDQRPLTSKPSGDAALDDGTRGLSVALVQAWHSDLRALLDEAVAV